MRKRDPSTTPEMMLNRRLNRIGRESFIRHFWLYDRYAKDGIEKSAVMETLLKHPDNRKSWDGCRLAINAARLIFKDKQEKDVINQIFQTDSHMISGSLRLKAIAIYDHLVSKEVPIQDVEPNPDPYAD